MRVATIASLAVAAAIGLTPAAHACSLGSGSSGSGPLSTIGHAVSSTVFYIINIFYISNNTTNDNSTTNVTNSTPAQGAQTAQVQGTQAAQQTTQTTPAAQTATTQAASATQGTQAAQGGAGGGAGAGGTTAGFTAFSSPAPSMGGGGGGVGGGGIGGGGFGSSSGIAGLPINPSAELALPPASMVAFGGTGTTPSLLIASTAPPPQTSGVTFATTGAQEDTEPVGGVTIVSTVPVATGSDDPPALPIAAITRSTMPGSGSASPSAFVFDGPASERPPIAPRSYALLLSGLGGVAALGAAWAWKSMV